MPQQAPERLPKDFFDQSAPDRLPADFFNDKSQAERSKPEDHGFVSRAYDASIGPLVNLGQALGRNYKPEPYENMVVAGAKAGLTTLRDVGSGMRDAYSKAPGKSVGEKAFNAFVEPTIGLIDADVKEGNYAGAAGTAIGSLATLMAPELSRTPAAQKIGGSIRKAGSLATTEGIEATAAALEESARKTYGQVLNPTKQGTKYLSQNQVVPGLLERGVVSRSLKSLQNKVAGNVEKLGEQIGDYWQKMPDDALAPVDDIINRVRSEAQAAHTIPGADGKPLPIGDVGESAMNSSESLANFLENASVADANGVRQIPVKRLREVRQYFDDVAARGKRYQGADLSEASKAETYGRVADAIREEFAKADPSLDALNKEFSFWKNAEKVVDETVLRREGQAKPLTRTVAEAAGFAAGAKGGPITAILGKYGMAAFEGLRTSTAWRTLSAVSKDRLAKALAKGDKLGARIEVEKMAKEAAKAPKELPGVDQN